MPRTRTILRESEHGVNTSIDARKHLGGLVGETIRTLTGRPNTILRIEGADVIVGTGRSPSGQPVPIQWVQDAIDQLFEKGELAIEVETVGYRSAFIGAVLATLPNVEVKPGTRRLRVERGTAQDTGARLKDLPPRSRQLVEATPLHSTESGVKACVEMTVYHDGHAGISVSRIEGPPGHRIVTQVDTLPLNDVEELRAHVLAVIARLPGAADEPLASE
jgi:hypothetical protein